MEFSNTRYIKKFKLQLSTKTFITNSLNIIKYLKKQFCDFLRKDKFICKTLAFVEL